MAHVDLSAVAPGQTDGSFSVDATLASNKITLPGWANELNIYIDDTVTGEFTLTDPTAAGRPLPGQTWTRVWQQMPRSPTQNKYVWVASDAGAQTVHYLLS